MVGGLFDDARISEAYERLEYAKINAASARRRVVGESPHPPLPPLDGVVYEINRAMRLLMAYARPPVDEGRCVCCTNDCGDRSGHVRSKAYAAAGAGEWCNCGREWPCPERGAQ